MLCGRYPFHDSDPSQLFCKIRLGQFHVPPSLSPLVRCLIRSLLRKDPTERLTAQDVLASKWFKHMRHPSSNYSRYHLAISNLELLERSYSQLANQTNRQSTNQLANPSQASNSNRPSPAASRTIVAQAQTDVSISLRDGPISRQHTMPLNLTVGLPSTLNGSEQSTSSIRPLTFSSLATAPAQPRSSRSADPIQPTQSIQSAPSSTRNSLIHSPAAGLIGAIRQTSYLRSAVSRNSLRVSASLSALQASPYYLPLGRGEPINFNSDQRVPDLESANDLNSLYPNTSILY